MFVQQFVQAAWYQRKIKIPHYCPFGMEFTSDQWIPRRFKNAGSITKSWHLHERWHAAWQTKWVFIITYSKIVSSEQHITNARHLSQHRLKYATWVLLKCMKICVTLAPVLTHWGWVTHIRVSVNLPSSVQILACRLVSAKPLSKQMLKPCWFDPYKQTSVRYQSTFVSLFKNIHLKMTSAKCRPFCFSLKELKMVLMLNWNSFIFLLHYNSPELSVPVDLI